MTQGELRQAEGRFTAHVVSQLGVRTYLVTLGGEVKIGNAVSETARAASLLVEATYQGIRNGVTELVAVLVPLS